MKKVSTAAAKPTRNVQDQRLTIGLNLGDRWSWYCVLDEAGEVLVEQRLGTTPKAMKEVFGGMPRQPEFGELCGLSLAIWWCGAGT
jgi:transposase